MLGLVWLVGVSYGHSRAAVQCGGVRCPAGEDHCCVVKVTSPCQVSKKTSIGSVVQDFKKQLRFILVTFPRPCS